MALIYLILKPSWHMRSFGWWALQDSNLGPTGYEPVALTAELRAPSRNHKL